MMQLTIEFPAGAQPRFRGKVASARRCVMAPNAAGTGIPLSVSSVQRLLREDLDAEAAEPDEGALGRRQQPDRAHPEVLEDLRAQPDLPPLTGARRLGAGRAVLRNGGGGDASRAVAQIDDDAAAFIPEPMQSGMDGLGVPEHVADDVGAVQA